MYKDYTYPSLIGLSGFDSISASPALLLKRNNLKQLLQTNSLKHLRPVILSLCHAYLCWYARPLKRLCKNKKLMHFLKIFEFQMTTYSVFAWSTTSLEKMLTNNATSVLPKVKNARQFSSLFSSLQLLTFLIFGNPGATNEFVVAQDMISFLKYCFVIIWVKNKSSNKTKNEYLKFIIFIVFFISYYIKIFVPNCNLNII